MSKHVCPHCGGLRFITVAHVAQDWEVDENGNFLDEVETTETVAPPDDGNSWTCCNCGEDGVVVPEAYCEEKIGLCATVMRRLIDKTLNAPSVKWERVFDKAVSVFGQETVAAVVACSILHAWTSGVSVSNDIRKWAEKKKQHLPGKLQEDMSPAALEMDGEWAEIVIVFAADKLVNNEVGNSDYVKDAQKDIRSKVKDCVFECDCETCLMNPQGVCLLPLFGKGQPYITEEDGCLSFVLKEE